MSEDFKTELRKLCMEMDLDIGEYHHNTPFGVILGLRGCEIYRYFLTKMKIQNKEFIKEVEEYELEYNTNKKEVVYKI